MEKKKINSRTTKQEILEYAETMEDQLKIYEEKLKKLQLSLTPDKQISKTIQRDKELKLEGFCINDLTTLETSVKSFINDFLSNMDSLELVKDQIAVEKDRLENIYKIKVEAESLFALMASKKEIIDSLNQKIKDLEGYYQTEKENKEDQLQSVLTQISLKAKYAREEETIKFNSELNSQRKKLEKDKAELKEKEMELEKLNETVEKLNSVIGTYDLNKDFEIQAAVEMAKEAFNKEKDHEIQLIKAKFDKEIAVLTCENKIIEDNMAGLANQLALLQESLEQSNRSITEIANKTVDNYHMQKSLQDMKTMAITTATNNSNQKNR